jgi:oligopeptide/dipeptide ABC transporter ATP-binding protein
MPTHAARSRTRGRCGRVPLPSLVQGRQPATPFRACAEAHHAAVTPRPHAAPRATRPGPVTFSRSIRVPSGVRILKPASIMSSRSAFLEDGLELSPLPPPRSLQVAVMYRGRIVERGPAAEIFESPAHPNNEGLLAAIPTTEVGKLAPALAGEPPATTGRIVGCSFASRCSYVRDRCRNDDPPLYEVSSTRGSACHYSGEVLAHAIRLHSGEGLWSADHRARLEALEKLLRQGPSVLREGHPLGGTAVRQQAARRARWKP